VWQELASFWPQRAGREWRLRIACCLYAIFLAGFGKHSKTERRKPAKSSTW